MGSSAGRRSAAYKAYKAHIQRTRPPCWLQSGPWCTGTGDTVDHEPAMVTVGGPQAWDALHRQGQASWKPACKPCQDRQGPQVRNRPQHPSWTF